MNRRSSTERTIEVKYRSENHAIEGHHKQSADRSASYDACVIGFDSAWTDREERKGAICSIDMGADGSKTFTKPKLSSFGDAVGFIKDKSARCRICFVAIDQPTIVPNHSGMRPVERVAAALIGYIGGGVQPANRSKIRMFDDSAPIWRFLDQLKTQLNAIESPLHSRNCQTGLHIVEVFPALALPAFDDAFYGQKKAPKYNPKNKKKFKLGDWNAVVDAADRYGNLHDIEGLEAWFAKTRDSENPTKSDQDQLDAILCALICYHWRYGPAEESLMIGDLKMGYMISRVSEQTRRHLEEAAAEHGVPARSQ